ncbi:MAG: zinc-dependent alcohol dehydrogenase family protein [Deltaproteobacteria bacterium]|nr:zinc-dependent alcohol dehydrogenase family protein [Deltaproteobacteria bacterium]
MKALMLEQKGPVESHPLVEKDVKIPDPQAEEVLVRITACGVCRTDLHVVEGDLPDGLNPVIPGHQVAGVVEKLGSGCIERRIGDRVGVAWLHKTCQQCEFCLTGRENLCPRSLYTGYTRHGGYAEYITAPEKFVYLLPESFSDIEATPLLCAGIIGYRALKRSALPRGGSLAIYGFGSSAHVTIQIAQYWGARVFVATRGEKHRRFARELGAVWVGEAGDLPPEPVDSAIVFAPAGELVPPALRALKKGGTAALAGIHMSDIPALNYEQCLFHEKNLCSVESNTRQDGRELLEIAAAIPIRPSVTTFPLGEANQVLERLKRDGFDGTAVLVP